MVDTSTSPSSATESSAGRYPLSLVLPASDGVAAWRNAEFSSWMQRLRPTLHVFPAVLRDGLNLAANTLTITDEAGTIYVLESLWHHATRAMEPGETLGRYKPLMHRLYAVVATAAGLPPRPRSPGEEG